MDSEQYKVIPDWVKSSEAKLLDICNELGITSENEIKLFHGIVNYALKYNTTYIPIDGLYKYLYEYGITNNINSLKNYDSISTIFKKVYPILYKNKYCDIESLNNKLNALILQDPTTLISNEEIKELLNKIKNEYEDIKKDLRKPFPSIELITKKQISHLYLNIININELTKEKINELQKKGVITKINITNNQNIVIPNNELPNLFQLSVKKIYYFLYNSQEYFTLLSKKVCQKHQKTNNFKTLDDFFKFVNQDYQYWITLTNEIINYLHNSEKEWFIVQAALIMKNISIIYNVDSQKKLHEQKTMEILLKIMETYNIAYTKGQFLQFREKHNYLRLYSERDYINVVNKFLDTYTKTPDSLEPPVIITISVGDESKYIHRIHICYMLFSKIEVLEFDLRKIIFNRLEQVDYNYKKDPIFLSESDYENFVDNYIMKKDPFVYNFLQNYSLLYRLILFHYGSNKESLEKTIHKFFHPLESGDTIPKIKPLSHIFNLNLENVLDEIKLMKPLKLSLLEIIENIIKWFFSFGEKVEKTIDKQLEIKKEMEKTILKLREKGKEQKELNPTSYKRKPIEVKTEQKVLKENDKNIEERNKYKEESQKRAMLKKKLEEFQKELTLGKSTKEMLTFYEQKWNKNIVKEKRQENLNYIIKKIHSRMKFMKDATPEMIKEEANNMIKTEEKLEIISDKNALKNYIMIYMVNHFLSKH